MPVGSLLRFIRRLASPAPLGDATDGQLVRRFAAHNDEAAFTALLQRHGPMVLGVCRRVLGDAHEAEDAFQAACIVFVRKAGSIARPELLGNWLYGVAYRTALKAKSRRRPHVTLVTDVPVETALPALWTDVRPVLDEEVNRLPAKYRLAFALCYLEGRTNEDTARLLGCPLGTVLSRLAWARQRLRARLTRRGLALPAVLFTAILAESVTAAAVPPALAASTIHAAMAAGSGKVLMSANVAALSHGVLKAMFYDKLKIASAAVLALALLGGVVAVHTLGSDPQQGANPPKIEPRPAAVDPPKTDKDKLQGPWTVVNAERDGKEFRIRGDRWLFKGDKVTIKTRDREDVCTYTLEPAATPKTIDVMVPGDKKADVLEGIYELKGDNLKFCFSLPDGPKERPNAFVTKPGSKRVLLILERGDKKDAEREKEEADAKPIEEAKNARVRIKIATAEPRVELNRDGKPTGVSQIELSLEVENLDDRAVSLTMPSLKVSGDGVTKAGLSLPKPEAWYYGEKKVFADKWDGKLRPQEKKQIVLQYLKIDRQLTHVLIPAEIVQMEIVFTGGDGDGLQLRSRRTKVASAQQE